MEKSQGIERLEKYAKTKGELNYIDNVIYRDDVVSETINVWLDALEKGENIGINTLDDFIDALVELDIDNFKCVTLSDIVNKKAKQLDVIGIIDNEILSKMFESIQYEVDQETLEEDHIAYGVNFKFTPEQELLFKLLEMDQYFATNSFKVANIFYNDTMSNYC